MVGPGAGVSAEVRARGLLSHEAGGFAERGWSGTLVFDPAPETARGVSFTLAQSAGAVDGGGVQALLGRETMAGLGAGDGGDAARRLEATFGYGFAVFGERFIATPEVGVVRTGAETERRLGWRLAEARGEGLVFGLDVEGAWREGAGGGGGDSRLGLGFGWRLEERRPGGMGLELRIEGSRADGAHDARPEHGLGVRLTARW